MEIIYQGRKLDTSIRQAFARLFPEEGVDTAQGRLSWRFTKNPAGQGELIIATASDQIVGINAFVPAVFKIGDSRLCGHQSMDTVVDPIARGKGVFTNLVNHFYRGGEAKALVYGFPNLNSSPGFFNKLGWKHLGTPPFLVKPLRAGYFLRRIWRNSPDFRVSFPRHRGAELLRSFSSDANEIWSQFSRDVGCSVDRTAQYLNWRITEHPVARYRTLSLPGSFVTTHLVDKHGGKVGYVMEAIGAATLPDTLESALHDLSLNGAEVVLAWCFPWSPNYHAYRKTGFFPLPERFRPVRFNFGARAIESAANAAETLTSWYVSYLDSDTV